MNAFCRAVAFGGLLLIATSLPGSGHSTSVTAQATLDGRVLASARGQVAWLDLLAPRPTPLTQLLRPAYPADVAAAPGVPFAVASIVGAFHGGGGLGGDLTIVDLQSGTSRQLLARESETESLDMPAIWPDGSGILYLHQIADVTDDDPSVARSPDGSQLLVYGGWGSFVVEAASGSSEALSFLAGYGSVAWLPD